MICRMIWNPVPPRAGRAARGAASVDVLSIGVGPGGRSVVELEGVSGPGRSPSIPSR